MRLYAFNMAHPKLGRAQTLWAVLLLVVLPPRRAHTAAADDPGAPFALELRGWAGQRSQVRQIIAPGDLLQLEVRVTAVSQSPDETRHGPAVSVLATWRLHAEGESWSIEETRFSLEALGDHSLHIRVVGMAMIREGGVMAATVTLTI